MGEELEGFIVVNYKKSDRDTWIHFLTEIDSNCNDPAEMVSPTAKIIYTSRFNAWYLKEILGVTNTCIFGIDVGKSHCIKHAGRQFSFSFFESKTFTGSVALLLNGDFGVYLYTGKFCYYHGITSLICSNMKSFINEKLVTRLYFDATYYEQNSEFMGYDELIFEISKIIKQSSRNIIYIIVDKLGLETLLIDVASTINKGNLQELLHVDKKRFEVMSVLGRSHLFTTDEKESRIYVRSSNFLKKKHEDKDCFDLIFIRRKSDFCKSFESYQNVKGWHSFTFYSHSSHERCCNLINFLKPEIVIPINNYFSDNLSKNKEMENPNLLRFEDRFEKKFSEIGDMNFHEEANKVNSAKDTSELPQFVNEISLSRINGQSLTGNSAEGKNVINLPFRKTNLQYSSKNYPTKDGMQQSEQKSASETEIGRPEAKNYPVSFPNTNINSENNSISPKTYIQERSLDKFTNLKLHIKEESKIFRQLLLFHIKHYKTKFKFKTRNNEITSTKKLKLYPSNEILRKLFLNSLKYGHVCLKRQDTQNKVKTKFVSNNIIGSSNKLLNSLGRKQVVEVSCGIEVLEIKDFVPGQSSHKSKLESKGLLRKPTELKNHEHYLQNSELKNTIDKFERKSDFINCSSELSVIFKEKTSNVNKVFQSLSRITPSKNKSTFSDLSSKSINTEDTAAKQNFISTIAHSPPLRHKKNYFFSPLKQRYLPAVFPNEFNGFEESAINGDLIVFQYFNHLLKNLCNR